MNNLRNFLSVVTAAAILVTTSGIQAFANNENSEVSIDKLCNANEYVYVDQNGNIYEPNLIPEAIPIENANTDALSPYYNLVEEGRVTSIKNQNPLGSCWSHAGCAAAESNMITDGSASSSLDLSEQHLLWFSNGCGPTSTSDPLYGDCGTSYGVDCYDKGGILYDVMGCLTRWSGVQLEANAPYANALSGLTLPESQRYVSYGHAANILQYDSSDITSIKNALVNNGACYMSYYHNNSYFNDTYDAYYTTSEASNHAVTIVGWDDNFNYTNFNSSCRPSSNGAWIVKNSWGTSWGDNGYFYLSYEDASLNSVASIDMQSTTNYADNYQYDGSIGMIASGNLIYLNIYSYSSVFSGANVYTAKNNNPLAAVGFYTFDADTPYKISVYTNVTGEPTSGTLAHTQSGTATYAGFHTIDLTKNIALTSGKKFSVIISFTNSSKSIVAFDNYSGTSGISYYGFTSSPSSSTTWYDAYEEEGKSFCVKAFTASSVPEPTVTATTSSTISLNWGAISGATNYAVNYKTASGSWMSIGTTSTTATITGLTPSTAYTLLVRAYVNGKWTSYTSANYVYATTLANTVPVTTVTGKTSSTVSLSWTSITNATNYSVNYKTASGSWMSIGTTSSTATITGLTPSTAYTILVRAYVNGKWSSYTSANYVYATTLASTAPVITVTGKTSSTVSLSWTAIANATNYAVNYKTASGSWMSIGTTATTATITGLTPSTAYTLLVRAYVNGKWSSYTSANYAYATTLASTAPVITVTGKTSSTVSLNWAAIANATNYAVNYKTASGSWMSIGTTSTTATITGLTPSTAYTLLVRAYVNGKWSSYTSANYAYATTLASTTPEITVTGKTSSTVSLSWTSITNAANYAVNYKTASGSWMSIGTTSTTATITGLTPSTAYTLLVRAYVDGSWSTFTSANYAYVTTADDTAPIITVTGTADDIISISWDAITNATIYSVNYKTDSGSWQTSSTTATTATITGLTASTKYTLLVRAYVDGAWSSYTTDNTVTAYTTYANNNPVVVCNVSGTSCTISWSKVTNVTQYRLYKMAPGSDTYTLFLTTNANKISTTLSSGTTKFAVSINVSGVWNDITEGNATLVTV